MHESRSWHLTNTLPIVTNHVIFLYTVQRHKIETSKNKDFLWFKDRHCWMRTTRLFHGCNICPLFFSLLEFLDTTHVIVSVKTTNRIYAISKHCSRKGPSGLIHVGKQPPFFILWIIYLSWSQRRIIDTSKTSYCIDFIVLAHYHCQLVSGFMHRLDFFPLSSCNIKSLNRTENAFTIITTNKVKQIPYIDDSEATSISTHRLITSPFISYNIVLLWVIHSFLPFLAAKEIKLLVDGNRTELRTIGR